MKEISFRNDVLPMKNELFRLALRITLDRAEAEDVVQDTLIKVWDKRDSWTTIDNIEAFAMTVCRNLALDRTRSGANNNVSLDMEGAQGTNDADDPLRQNGAAGQSEDGRTDCRLPSGETAQLHTAPGFRGKGL